MTATMTSKGQITIPVEIRRKLRLEPGSVLQFDPDAHYLKARHIFDEKKARAVLGCAQQALPGKSGERWLSETRGRKVKLRR